LHLSWPGKKQSRADFPFNNVWNSYEISSQTAYVNGKSARLSFLPSQLKSKQLCQSVTITRTAMMIKKQVHMHRLIYMHTHNRYVDSALAKQVLRFNPRPWQDTLCDTLSYIRTDGHLMGLPKGVPNIELRGPCARLSKL
jgi:hypothetical protein